MIQFRMKCAISHPLICICFQRWKFIFNQTFCVSILYSAVLRLFQAILIFTRLQTNFILRHVDYNWKSNTMQNMAKYYCQTHICTKKCFRFHRKLFAITHLKPTIKLYKHIYQLSLFAISKNFVKLLFWYFPGFRHEIA